MHDPKRKATNAERRLAMVTAGLFAQWQSRLLEIAAGKRAVTDEEIAKMRKMTEAK